MDEISDGGSIPPSSINKQTGYSRLFVYAEEWGESNKEGARAGRHERKEKVRWTFDADGA